MATLTNGEKMVLFMLLSVRSELRFQLEGRSGGNPPEDPDEFLARLKQLAPSVHVDPNNIDVSLRDLFSNETIAGAPNNQVGNITTNHNKIIAKLGLDGALVNDVPYSKDNPCPGGTNQEAIAVAILKAI